MTIAWFLFIVSVIVSAYAQRSYFEELANRRGSVRHDADVTLEMLAHPQRIVLLAWAESSRRIRKLVARQADPSLERKRLIAVASVTVMVACFVWLAVGR